MDIRYFLSILKRRFWIILLVTIIAAITTYLLVGRMADKYKADAILSTGIIDNTAFKIEDLNAFMQEFVTKTKFSNKIKTMTNPTSISLLTRRLLLHDLNEDESRFRVLTSGGKNNDLYEFDQESILRFTAELNDYRDSMLHPKDTDREHQLFFKRLSRALGYDRESLLEDLEIKRIGETDYLSVEFISENPELSYFTVNTFCDEIIQYFRNEHLDKENEGVSFFRQDLRAKKMRFDSLTKIVNDFRFGNGISDIEDETKSIVSQIKELEFRRENHNLKIPALKENLRRMEFEIERTKNNNANGYAEFVDLNSKIDRINKEIKNLEDKISRSPGQKNKTLEKKQNIKIKEREKLSERLSSSSVKDLDEAKRENKELRDKKRTMQFELEEAENAVKSLDRELRKKKGKKVNIASNDAELGVIQQQWEVSKEEYLEATGRLKKAQLESRKPESELEIIEYAEIPEKPESKNLAIMSAFSGVASGILATLIIFLFSFFDNSSNSPYRFSQNYDLPLSGHINRIKKKNMNLNSIFNGSVSSKTVEAFKENLRKIRYAVETSGANTILVTSNKAQEGKSFFLLSLAYSLSLGNRKVLVIDTNIRNNSLSKLANLGQDAVPFVRPTRIPNNNSNHLSSLPVHVGNLPNNVDILGNFGGDMSPNEALAGNDFVRLLYDYQQKYDYILLEGPALNDYADSKELSLYVDKVIGVFAAQSSKVTADEESIGFLNSLGEKYLGSILNRVDRLD